MEISRQFKCNRPANQSKTDDILRKIAYSKREQLIFLNGAASWVLAAEAFGNY